MLSLLKRFMKEEDGLGTVEIVIIIAVLVGIALIFRNVIIEFIKDLLDGIFGKKDSASVDSDKISDGITKKGSN